MGKLIWRVFALLLLVVAFIPSIAATQTSFVPLIFISIISILFLILEFPSKGAIAFVQNLAIRFVFASLIFFGAFVLYQQGLSEFMTPLTPTRFISKVIFETLRAVLEPTYMALLFFTLSFLCFVIGTYYLFTGKVIYFGKRPCEANNV